jgi:predicted nuclease of restriction endonuclease-like (RecB) superfamily
LPWGHIIVLMEQVKDPEARAWYVNNTLKNGIARSVLIIQIEQNLYERQGKDAHKITNFAERLPSPQSDLAIQLFKDPYDFRFLPVTEEAEKLEIENSMVAHLRELFIELGTGFAYMGHQYKITVGEEDYFLDMLFYNVHLSCFFVAEIKTTPVKPEHIGKLNFYLAVVDDVLRKPHDNPTIGLLLCKKHNKLVAEYSLKRTDGAIGIAEYRLSHKLPKELKESLPDLDILEAKLAEKLDIEGS